MLEGNKKWASNAAVLVVVVSKKNFEYNDQYSITHQYDAGAAWENLALQASLKGLVAHGMQGFDYERARKELEVPDNFDVMAMIAIGDYQSHYLISKDDIKPKYMTNPINSS